MPARTGYRKILAATLLFSVNPALFRLVELDAISMLWTVNALAVLALAPKASLLRRNTGILERSGGLVPLLLLGVSFTLNNTLFITAIKATTIANAVFSHYLAPVFLLILGLVFLREKPTAVSILAVAVSLTGLFFILSPSPIRLSERHFAGTLLGTASAVFFSLEIMLKKTLTRNYDVEVIVILYLALSVLLLLPFISVPAILSLRAVDAALLLISGIVCSAAGITLFTAGLKEVAAHRAGVMSYIEPAGAVLWGSVAAAELPGRAVLAGGLLILLGISLIGLRTDSSG
jgi:RarD protein